MSPRFIEATGQSGQVWIDKASRGVPVTPEERNAFVYQCAGAMDFLADPRALLNPAGPQVPSVPYNGPNARWNGRNVPLVGSREPPREWFKARDANTTKRTGAGLYTRSAGAVTLADLLSPTDEERRTLWLAGAGTLRSLSVEGTPTRAGAGLYGRSAGNPLIVGAVVLCVMGLGALAAWATTRREEIRENAATARWAQQLAAAQAAWLQRVQHQATHPGQPLPPPSPAEQAVLANPATGGPSPARREADSFESMAQRWALYGFAGLLVVTAGPPVVANVADRLTRPRSV